MKTTSTGGGWWHATYEDYLDTFLTADDAFFWDGDLDSARALVEAGLRGGGGNGGGGGGEGAGSTRSNNNSKSNSSAAPSFSGAALSRREWTLARGRAAAARLARPDPLLSGGRRPCRARRAPRLPPLLSDAAALPADECPLLRLLALRERAVRSGSLAVVVYLRARNSAGQECSAYVDLAARLAGAGAALAAGGGGGGGGGGRQGEDDGGAGFGDDEGDEGEEASEGDGEEGGLHDDDDNGVEATAAAHEEEEEEEEDDGDEDAAERRAAAAERRKQDASRGMAGVFARVKPFLPQPTDLCYYNHATRRACANPTAQWQVAPSFGCGDGAGGDGAGGDGAGGDGGGRLLLRHVRDRRVLDVGAAAGGGGTSARTVVDLSGAGGDDGGGGGGGGAAPESGEKGGAQGGAIASAAAPLPPPPPPLPLSERAYLLQAIVFDHVVRRR